MEVWNVALRTQSATGSLWNFYLASWITHYRPKSFQGSPLKKKRDLFWRKTFPLLSASVGQVFAGQAKLGPECLDILAQFSLGLQITIGFMPNLHWITVFLLLLMLPAPIFFMVGGSKR